MFTQRDVVRVRNERARRRTVLSLALLSSFGSGGALAQIAPEVPLTRPMVTGARALGMGGAWTAVSDDISALEYNPAGLAQLTRTQFTLALDRRSLDQDVTYLGQLEPSSGSRTRLHNAGFAYPFPTYRGSLVFATSYQQWVPMESEYFRAGRGGNILDEEESITETGNIGAWQAGLGGDVSRVLSVGATAVILSGDSDRVREFWFERDDNGDFESTITETSLDITGLTGRLGVLYRGDRGVRAGFVIHLPQAYRLDGSLYDDVIRYAGPDTLDYIDDAVFDDAELTVPASFTGAVSYETRRFLVSGEVTFTNWEDLKDDQGLFRFGREFAYRSTADVRVGAEYRFPGQPLALRGGFRSSPLPYDLIAVDVFQGVAERPQYDPNYIAWSLGLGFELDASLIADIAYTRSSFQRSGSIDGRETIEEQTEQRVLFGVTFLQTR